MPRRDVTRIRGGFAVDVRHGVLERLAIDIRNNDDTGLLRLPTRLGLERIPLRAHEDIRFSRGRAEDRLVFVGQTLPGPQRHHQYLRRHGVLSERVKWRRLVVIGGDVGWQIVFRAINDMGGESGLDLAIRQLERHCAECPDHVNHQGRLLDPDTQSFEIG